MGFPFSEKPAKRDTPSMVSPIASKALAERTTVMSTPVVAGLVFLFSDLFAMSFGNPSFLLTVAPLQIGLIVFATFGQIVKDN